MASPTQRAQNVWETQNGNDFLQFLSTSGAVLGGVDATGTGFGNFTNPNIVQATLSSAQLLALASTPVTIIPAPGAGKTIFVLSTFWQYKFNTTAYTLGNSDNQFNLEFAGGTSTFAVQFAAGLVDQTVNTLSMIGFGADQTSIAQSLAANTAIRIALTGTTPGLTLGDGSLVVTVYYFVTPTN